MAPKCCKSTVPHNFLIVLLQEPPERFINFDNIDSRHGSSQAPPRISCCHSFRPSSHRLPSSHLRNFAPFRMTCKLGVRANFRCVANFLPRCPIHEDTPQILLFLLRVFTPPENYLILSRIIRSFSFQICFYRKSIIFLLKIWGLLLLHLIFLGH